MLLEEVAHEEVDVGVDVDALDEDVEELVVVELLNDMLLEVVIAEKVDVEADVDALDEDVEEPVVVVLLERTSASAKRCISSKRN
mmetsp:Transcript_14049/g.33132  ORF Transcript_14049/g.33132 Transcript_14049/m.33132 type:complete len:85 (+) Transcript_14049:90-344(+)